MLTIKKRFQNEYSVTVDGGQEEEMDSICLAHAAIPKQKLSETVIDWWQTTYVFATDQIPIEVFEVHLKDWQKTASVEEHYQWELKRLKIDQGERISMYLDKIAKLEDIIVQSTKDIGNLLTKLSQ